MDNNLFVISSKLDNVVWLNIRVDKSHRLGFCYCSTYLPDFFEFEEAIYILEHLSSINKNRRFKINPMPIGYKIINI